MSSRFAEICGAAYRCKLLPLLGLSVGACGGDEQEIRTFRDTGTLCLLPNDTGGTTVAVFFDLCLSCGDRAIASCKATVNRDRVAISTALDVIGGGHDAPLECPADCSFASARCELAVPSPGDYAIVLYGGQSATVMLPVESPVAPYGDRQCAP
jgi:hypothetical protein